MRKFTRILAGTVCECTEAFRQGYMRLKLEASFGDGYDIVETMRIPIDMPDEAINILSDFWLTKKEQELGLPIGCSCNTSSWWAGHADTDWDYLLTEKHRGLIADVIQHMNEKCQYGYNPLNIYFDKHGKQILADMYIRHESGDQEKVYSCATNGIEDLGVDAVRPAWREKHPDCENEFYSLRDFDLKEWEIVSQD